MSNIRIVKRDPSSPDKEVSLEIDPVGSSLPDIKTYSVKGKVLDYKDKPQVGRQVVAYHKGLGVNDLTPIGSVAVTSATGNYLIYYTTDQLNGSLFADLLVKVFEAGADVATAEAIAESEWYPDAIAHEEIDINVSEEEYIGPSEYDRLAEDLAPHLPNAVDFSVLTLESLEILAAKIDQPPVIIGDYLKAKDFHDTYYGTTPAVTEEVIYGMLRSDLPYEYHDFLEVSDEDKVEALEAATDSNIIDPDLADDIPAILAAFREAKFENGLIDDETRGPSYAAQLLTIAGIVDNVKQKGFYACYREIGDDEDLWDKLVTDGILTPAEQDKAKFVFSLSLVTQSHLPMIQNLWADAGIASVEDLGSLDESGWLTKINAESAGVPNVMPPYEDGEDAEYAQALVNTVERLYPSKVLDKEIDADGDPEADFDVLQELINTYGYDIKDDSPRKKFEEISGGEASLSKAEAGNSEGEKRITARAAARVADSRKNYTPQQKEQVFRARRLFHVLKGRDKIRKIKAFFAAKLQSATHITKKSRRKFVKDYTGLLGGRQEAITTYQKAYKRKAAALMLYAQYGNPFNSTHTFVSPKPPMPTRKDQLPGTEPQLEVFFGSQDYCACKHCGSSVGPAAYLVDLLEFLKEAENRSDPSLSAWAILKSRRPDLAKIRLTCDNTNTTMPYIDLVNEVLEHAVNSSAAVSRQTSGASDELRIMPGHLDKGAYDTLAAAIYPWRVPFHLWNEEAGAYLGQLELPRHQMVRARQGNYGQTAGISIEEACTQLGISSAMLNNVLLTTSYTAFYGGANAAALASVETLLQRSGLEYKELLELTDTRFINAVDVKITFTPAFSCDPADASLPFTAGQYANMHRFHRLERLLGWGVRELDMVLDALNAVTINRTVIIQLAGVRRLAQRFGLSPSVVAAWYGNLSYRTYGHEGTQYETVYLNAAFNSADMVRAAFGAVITAAAGTVGITDDTGTIDQANVAVVAAALEWSAQDVLLLTEAEVADPAALGLDELSHLYRVATFTKAAGLSAKEYLDLKAITGMTPVTTPAAGRAPDDTLAFLTWLEALRAGKVTIKDLRFLFLNDFREVPSANTEHLVATATKLRARLIGKSEESGISSNRSDEGLLSLFRYFFNEIDAVASLDLLRNIPATAEAINAAAEFIDRHWGEPVSGFADDLSVIKDKLVSGGAGVLITDASERLDYAFRAFYPGLKANLLFGHEVARLLADHYEASLKEVESLLRLLANPGNAAQSVAEQLSDYDLVYGTADITRATHPDALSALLMLQKTLYVIRRLGIRADQLAFVLHKTGHTGWFDLSSFPYPASASSWDFGKFIALTQAFTLEKAYGTGSFSMIGLLREAAEAGTTDIRPVLMHKLSAAIGWEEADLRYLLALPELIGGVSDFHSEKWLVQLDGVFSLLRRLRVSAAQLAAWSSTDVSYEEAQAIRASVRANYSPASWKKTGADIRDRLRIKQRDALVAYLIAFRREFSDTNDLYRYFLLDTEMAPCALTSRIKLATSTVQLWVQRIRMNLETGMGFFDEDMKEWEWRKNYRVWEAARKVFLYPENWIEPELRDDKSLFFREMEDELLQDEVNAETAERAYLNYLKKADEIAHLEVAGMYQEKDLNVLHVFARTKNSPHIYFYRTLTDGITWTDWRRIEVDIEGDHLIPVVFNRRPMLFWPIFTESPKEVAPEQLEYDPKSQEKIVGKNQETVAEIQMAYSEWTNNKWQPKKISDARLLTDYGFDPEYYFFKAEEQASGLVIDVYYQEEDETVSNHLGEFSLNNCSGEIEVSEKQRTSPPSDFAISNTFRDYMKLKSRGARKFEITEKLDRTPMIGYAVDQSLKVHKTRLLNNTRNQFRITYPISENEILSEVPFFFEDGDRVFFVKPSEKTFTKKLLIALKPESFMAEVTKSRQIPIPVTIWQPPIKKYIKPTYPPKKRAIRTSTNPRQTTVSRTVRASGIIRPRGNGSIRFALLKRSFLRKF